MRPGGSRKTSAVPTEKGRKPSVEYLHEIQYDAETKSQWTFFNKHAIVRVDEEEPETPYEDVIADEMDIGGNTQNDTVSSIPESTWVALYRAKCMDLIIPCKPDKHQERFVTQMMLQQRKDRVCFKNQKLGRESASVIGNLILAGNNELCKVDLSENQLHLDFGQIVRGIRANERLISLIMRNNQINGSEHAAALKALVKGNATLTALDFGNGERNTCKNKIKNIGVQALVEGILETPDCSVISQLNLSYN